MKPERWREVERVLDRVLDAPAGERAALAAEACGDDAELRREVETLLAADARAPAFLDSDAAVFAAPAFERDGEDGEGPEVPGLGGGLAGETLGRYRLVREIGAGGMSRVFLAEREGGEFEQQVAVKVLRAVGLDLDEGSLRFRAERQILASLDHPSIARVFDGGTTGAGAPYLVMELIAGVPITEHCAGLELDERLDLFLGVCEAVHYAHQRLIVHRDLKPSNILVTRSGQLKLLDFGIAKLLAPDRLGLGGAAPVTRTGVRLMTPEYAAPELVRGEEVTTATDVYGLGVLLYEMLAGRRPFDLAGRSAVQIERAVCGEEPRRPSAVALGTFPGGAARWRRRLAGDLDTIVLAALRKEPSERYDSARSLADDVRRVRNGLPIAARPATAGYRMRKFVARHRWSVAAGAAALAALTVFAVAMTWQQGVTRSERDRARAAEEQAAAINRFLVDEMLGAAAPEVAQGRDVGVLAAAERRLEGAFAGQPQLEASVRRTLGGLYLSLGKADKAEPHLVRARELFAERLGEEDPETLVAKRLLAQLALAQGRYDEAWEQASRIVAVQRAALGADAPEVWTSEALLARADIERGNYGAAEARVEGLLAASVGADPPSPERIELEGVLAEAYARQRRWPEVEAAAERVLAYQRRSLGPNHPELARTLTTLGNAEGRNKRYAEAQISLEEALALRRRVLGEEHPDTLESLRALMIHFAQRELYPPALAYGERAAAAAHEVYGETHPWTVRADENLGVLHSRQGRPDLAEPIYREAARRHEALLGSVHPSTVRSYGNLSGSLFRQGKVDEAREAMRKVIAAGRERLAAGDEDPTFLSDFANTLLTCEPEDLRDPPAALRLAGRAVELTHREWDPALQNLARAHAALGELDRAIELQREVLEFPRVVAMMDSERYLIEFLEQKGDLEQVEVELRRHLERRRAARSADDAILGTSYRRLGLNLQKRGLLEPARAELARAVEQFARTLPPDDFQLLRAQSELGEVLTLLGRFAEAESLLLEAAEGLRGRIWFRDETSKVRSQERVAELYRAWGKPDAARDWARRAELSAQSPAPPAG